MTGSRSDAEDAVQETFLAVHERLARFRGGSAIGTWVYRIALHIALRVKSRRPRDFIELDEGLLGPGVEGALLARDEGRRVLQAMGRLPVEQREGYSKRETAAKCEVECEVECEVNGEIVATSLACRQFGWGWRGAVGCPLALALRYRRDFQSPPCLVRLL